MKIVSQFSTSRLRPSRDTAPIELTFIICTPEGSDASPSALTMIGDVNLFLKGTPEDPDFEVELEIMIAGMEQFDYNLSCVSSGADIAPFVLNS